MSESLSHRALAFVLVAVLVLSLLWPFTTRGGRSDQHALELLGRDVADLRKQVAEVLRQQGETVVSAGAGAGEQSNAVAAVAELAQELRALRVGSPGSLPALSKDIGATNRVDLGKQLQHEGKHRGAELAESVGTYAASLLKHWTVCQTYFLVDYTNESIAEPPLAAFEDSQKKRWEGKVHRLSPEKAGAHVSDLSLDYLYIDAWGSRGDMLEVLRDWWPKVRIGGIIAVTDAAMRKKAPKEAVAVRNAVTQLTFEVARPSQTLDEDGASTWLFRR